MLTVKTIAASPRSQAGFSLPELLIATGVLLIITSGVTSALLQMTNSQKTIWNRTQLHAGVRSATELLQQEVGQAGRIALPGTVTLATAIPVAGTQTVGVKVNGATPATMNGFFVGEHLVIEANGAQPTPPCVTTSPCQESVTVTAVDTVAKTITATFGYQHPLNGGVGATVSALGGFATGIVPPGPTYPGGTYTNGSTASVLKLFGDINGDGSMVYVEYTCDPMASGAAPTAAPPGTGNLYRNVMPYDQTTAKIAATSGQILLSNIEMNPGGTACFTYMPSPLYGAPRPDCPVGLTCPTPDAYPTDTYVLDVAITLTVRTQVKDPITNQYQTETKALLNVSPRNVFNVWQLASVGVKQRVQVMPPTVTAMLP
jgi:prepilin-type N-terminal cleavage/methylation domain-containing protein